MQTTINNQAGELKNQNELLEEKVAEKTQGLKKSLTQIEHEKQRVVEANKAKSIFLANMSHEIRTPLNGIIGLTQLLKDTPLDDEQQKFIDTLNLSGKHLINIINNILDFSKIESGNIELDTVELNLSSLIENVIQVLSPNAENKHVSMT